MSLQHNKLASLYIERLGLNYDPFDPAQPSIDYLYQNDSLDAIKKKLVELITQGEEPISIVGESGSGKSSLIKQIYQSLKQDWEIIWLDSDLVNSSSAADTLSKAFHPAQLVEKGKIVVIKNSELLEVATINHLIGLHGNFELPVRMIFSSNKELDVDDLAMLELKVLTKDEMEDFIGKKLSAAGYKGAMPLNNDEIAALYDSSGGNFHKINRLIPSLLAYERAAPSLGEQFSLPSTHIIGAAVLVLFLLLAFLIFGLVEDDTQAEAVEYPLASTQKLDEVSSSQSKPVELKLNTSKSNKTPSVTEKTVVSNKDIKPVPDAPKATVKPKLDIKTSESLKQVSSSLKSTIDSIKQKNKSVEKKQSTSVVSTPSELLNSAKREAVEQTSDFNVAVLDMKNDAYMLQILASGSKEYTLDLISRYNELAIYYYQTQRNGQPWYVLVSGPYDDYSKAKKAVAILPERFQKQKPWPKKISAIRQQMQ